MNFPGMKAKLVDVFAHHPLTGNGLTIFWDYKNLSSELMHNLTREMRQFESIFVECTQAPKGYKARIFTMAEELDFAGHPLIGLGAHLHEEYGSQKVHEWNVELNSKSVCLTSYRSGEYFSVEMEQGRPIFKKVLSKKDAQEILEALNLNRSSTGELPFEVISTGLPYLIIPITSGISNARITVGHFEALLGKHGAKFVYVLDINKKEGRTWDNLGKVEDIATGSAVGPAAAFLFKHNLLNGKTNIAIKQGRFVGRPSEINATIETEAGQIKNIIVKGKVCKVASIRF